MMADPKPFIDALGTLERDGNAEPIAALYADDADLASLLVAPYFADAVRSGVDAWRRVVSQAALAGIPTPAFSSSLAYYDGLRRERLPAALIQGQRDFFGAHTYRRVDRDGTFHTTWSADRTEIETGAAFAEHVTGACVVVAP